MATTPSSSELAPANPQNRTAYTPPKLTNYGNVTKITLGSGSSISDGGSFDGDVFTYPSETV